MKLRKSDVFPFVKILSIVIAGVHTLVPMLGIFENIGGGNFFLYILLLAYKNVNK